MRILIVQSDSEFAEDLKYNLEHDGYEVHIVNTVKRGIERYSASSYDFCIIDIQYTDGTGLDLKRMMSEVSDTPTMMVSKPTEKRNIILALEYGCDDYMERPIDPLELKTRIRAILRRVRKGEAKQEESPDKRETKKTLVFHPVGRLIEYNGKTTELTGREFDLLYTLSKQPLKVFSRERLAEIIHLEDCNLRTMDVHVKRLRSKLEEIGADHFLATKWGKGYFFNDNKTL